MTDLPIRLAKGDPAPADCVAVPLYGPTGSRMTGHSWRTVSHHLPDAWGEMADSFAVIADAAEAPLPLRKGDRVRVDEADALYHMPHIPDLKFCWVLYDDPDASGRQLVPLSAVTRIDDDKPCPNCDGRKCMAYVTREIHDDCVDDCPDCCPANDDEPESYPDWTPSEGQLVERISDGKCFRIRIRLPHKPETFDLLPICDNEPPYMPFSLADVRAMFRRRFLRVGDVIEATADESVYSRSAKGMIRAVNSRIAHTVGWSLMPPTIVHIEGLGPVPWPPTVEKANR